MENVNVYNITASILRRIEQIKDPSAKRALLANIRNSIGRGALNSPTAMAYLFASLPEELCGTGKDLNFYEKAVLTAVQLYALHQQSNEESVLKLDYIPGEYRQNMGDALRSLRNEDDTSIDKRFNIMISSDNFSQLENNLRHLIKLLKAKTEAKVDYAELANDLYWFLKHQKVGIRIKWGRSYYRIKLNSKLEDETGDESNDEKK